MGLGTHVAPNALHTTHGLCSTFAAVLVAIIIGFIFGFVGSMPVAGPIAALVFSSAIDGRFRNGLFIAAGCAAAEAGYAGLAFWGFASFLDDYAWIVPAANAVAAVILLLLGISFTRRDEGADPPVPRESKDANSFFLGFTIAALNPTLLATWAGGATLLASLDLIEMSPSLTIPFAGGACAGIITWNALLIGVIKRYRERFTYRALQRALRVFGLFLILVSFYFVYQFSTFLIQ